MREVKKVCTEGIVTALYITLSKCLLFRATCLPCTPAPATLDTSFRLPSGGAGGASPSSPSVEYRPASLWIDLFRSIVRSEKFIYITGWSVFLGEDVNVI